jgi:biopolymer transport protein ExbD
MFNLQEDKQSNAHPEGNMLPVINMTFLLLLFFIVVGSFAENLNREIFPPKSLSEVLAESGAVELELTREGVLIWEGQQTTVPAWADSFRAEGIDLPRKVRLRADGATPATHFIPVLEDLKFLQISRVALVTLNEDNVL